jgi:hypothetical protein
MWKGFMKKYMYWYAHEEPYVPHDTIVERMFGSTFSASNVHWVVDDNSNPSFRKDRSRVDWLSVVKTKHRGRVEVVQDGNDELTMGDDVF